MKNSDEIGSINKKILLSFIVILIVLIVLFLLTRYLNKNTTKNSIPERYKIGDTQEEKNFKITLTDAKFTDNVLVCLGEKADKQTFTNAEEFCTPYNSNFVDEEGYVIPGLHGFSINKDSNNTYLYYNIEFEYVGKEPVTLVDHLFEPKVTCNGYTFNSEYFSFYRTKSGEEITPWSNFNSEFNAISTVRALGLEIGYFSGKIQPLSKKIYEVRGLIPVSKDILEMNKDILLYLNGAEFLIEK